MTKFAFLVGVDGYLDPLRERLNYCVADATALAEALAECGFHSRLLLGKEATRGGIGDALASWKTILKPDDTFIFGLFLHGAYLPMPGGQFAQSYMAYDARRPYDYIDRHELIDLLEDIPARWRIAIFDACRSVPVAAGAPSEGRDTAREWSVLAERTSTLILDACRPGEQALENSGYGHGYFTHFLLEGIRNRAEADDKLTGWTVDGLDFQKLAEAVKLVVPTQSPQQHPHHEYSNGIISDEALLVADRNDGPVAAPDRELPGRALETSDPGDPEFAAPPEAAPAEARPKRRAQPLPGLAMAAVAVVALGFGAMTLLAPHKAVGEGAFCSGAPGAATAVLVDIRKGQLDDATRQRVADELGKASGVPEHGRLELWRLDPGSQDGMRLFADCRPQASLSADATNPATRFEQGWSAAVAKTVAEDTAPAPDAPAPLIATMRHIVLGVLPDSIEGARSLIVASDFVESTELYSQRGTVPDYGRFRESPTAKRFDVDLGGIGVRFYVVLPRPLDEAREQSLVGFWGSWLRKAAPDPARTMLCFVPSSQQCI